MEPSLATSEGVETVAIVGGIALWLAKTVYELVKGRSSGANLNDSIEKLVTTMNAGFANVAQALTVIAGETRETRRIVDEVAHRTETIERIAGSTKDDTSYIKARVNGGQR